jgi:lipoprotein-releasing system permease protein
MKNSFNKNFSLPVINISITAIALSISVMLISDSILNGFKNAVTQKVMGFSSHLQIVSIDQNLSLEPKKISIKKDVINQIKSSKSVIDVQPFIVKGALVKTSLSIEPVLMKGIDANFNFSFLKKFLVQGTVPVYGNILKDNLTNSTEVLVSKNWAEKNGLKLNSNFLCYFVQNPAKIRKYTIKGIFDTGLEEFDSKMIFCDLTQLQKINNWAKDEIAGFEIRLKNADEIKSVSENLYNNLPAELNVLSVQEIYPQIFDWLNLQDTNVIVIWGIMILVSILNIITVLLVLILEKTHLIGIVDALGMRKSSTKKAFLLLAGNIGLKGLAIGNVISLVCIFIQMEFKLIKLDAASYYVDYVPMIFDLKKVILINCFTFVTCVVSMYIPTRIINNMNTIDAIRFK